MTTYAARISIMHKMYTSRRPCTRGRVTYSAYCVRPKSMRPANGVLLLMFFFRYLGKVFFFFRRETLHHHHRRVYPIRDISYTGIRFASGIDVITSLLIMSVVVFCHASGYLYRTSTTIVFHSGFSPYSDYACDWMTRWIFTPRVIAISTKTHFACPRNRVERFE